MSLTVFLKEKSRRFFPTVYSRPDIQSILLLFAVTIITYANSFYNDFHFDDHVDILRNRLIRSDNFDIFQIWYYSPTRFMLFLAFSLLYKFFHLTPVVFHIFSLSCHLITILIVYFLAKIFFSKEASGTETGARIARKAMIAALIFAVHPLQTAAVTYVSKVIIVMATMFYLGAIWCFLRWIAKRRWYFYLAAFTLVILAMITKPVTITLPFALLLAFYFVYPQEFSYKSRAFWSAIPLLLTVFFIPLLLHAFGSAELLHKTGDFTRQTVGLSRYAYFVTETKVLCSYLRLMFLPFGQNADHDVPISFGFDEPAVFAATVFLTWLLIKGLRELKKGTLRGFCIVWFFLLLSVESTIIPIVEFKVEYRLYPVMFAFALFLTDLIYKMNLKGKVFLRVWFLVFAAYVVLSMLRNYIWSDKVRFWSDAAIKSPQKMRCYHNLGYAYHQRGNLKDAISCFRKSTALYPRYVTAYDNMCIAYLQLGLYDRAEDQVKKLEALGARSTAARCRRFIRIFRQMDDKRQKFDLPETILRDNPFF